MIRRLTGKRADLLAEEVIKAMAEMKKKAKTITFDNALEFSAHKSIAEGLESDICFNNPYASTGKILTRIRTVWYVGIPKDTNFDELTDKEVQFVMGRLNSRTRQQKFKSPNKMFLGAARRFTCCIKNCTYYLKLSFLFLN